MKTFWVLSMLLVGYLCAIATAAPAPAPAPADNQPGVQFLKYNNDKQLEDIQRQIIAQYEQLGGTSQFHTVQGAAIVDPRNLKINLQG